MPGVILGRCGPYVARSTPTWACRTAADLDISPLTWGFWVERTKVPERAKGIEPS